MTPAFRIRTDRATVRPQGGTRYLVLDLEEVPARSLPTAVVVARNQELEPYSDVLEGLVRQLSQQLAPAAVLGFADTVADLAVQPFAPGCALHEAWLRGCLSLAGDRLKPGHCLLITDGHATLGENRVKALAEQAAGVWENTGIATSVLAVGPRPHAALLKALAWHGGGRYYRIREHQPVRMEVPAPRLVLEVAAGAGIDVDLLTRTRGPRILSGLRQVVASVTFRGAVKPEVGLRLVDWEGPGAWQTLAFQVADSEGPKHAGVMRRVAAVLAKRTPDAPVPAGHTAEGAANLVGRFVPAQAEWPSMPPSPQEIQELSRGVILWGAVGSALGRPLVGLEPATIRRRYGPQGLTGYRDSRGTWSGDVQILREVAETVLEGEGSFDPEAFAVRLLALLKHNRGLGSACEAAGEALGRGQPWWKAGLAAHSAGNGAALRVAPLALAGCLGSLSQLYRELVVSSLVTHTHPVGVAGAVAMGLAVAWCVRERLAGRRAEALLDFVTGAIAGLELEPTPERRVGGKKITLCQRLGELPTLVRKPPEEALQVTWNGAFALESVPAAFYCFLKYRDEPRRALLTAVNAGSDSDSVGAMTGQLLGAWHGTTGLPRDWAEGLEARAELTELADRLAELAKRTAARRLEDTGE